MRNFKQILIFFLTIQTCTLFGQEISIFGSYKSGKSIIVLNQDSTFKYTAKLGCLGYTSSTGIFFVKNDTLILDTGIPIEWKEKARSDDSIRITIKNIMTNEPVPNIRVAFKFEPKTNDYLISSSNGSVLTTRDELDSIFIDRGAVEYSNDSVMLKNTYAFFNDYDDGKYSIKSPKGADILILVNFSLLNKCVIMNKENWVIIGTDKLFEPAVDMDEFKGWSYTKISEK